jgi:glycogen phosphorylase
MATTMSRFNRSLPPELEPLRELVLDLHWSWNHAGDQLLQRINADIWKLTENPVSVLQFTSDAQFASLAKDKKFLQELQNLITARRHYQQDPGWYQEYYAEEKLTGIAYFSMEFGLCDSLPLYAGGLGILAGDYLKTASDLSVPIVAIGLLYQEGYFHQSFDLNGTQEETYLFNDPSSLPLQELQASDGSWLTIETDFLCRKIYFRVWVAQVGKIKLYLLDSNHPCNLPHDRGITSKLYGSGSELRLVQEIALGICGWRLIEILQLSIDLCHLNEGHAAFATLERARHYSIKENVDFWHALWVTRAGNIFTTHTSVSAAFDLYPAEMLHHYFGLSTFELGISLKDLLALGRANPNDMNEPFNMAYLAMRTCINTNAVSQLHGCVSRQIFQPLFPRWPEREVPIDHVTNGVHVPTWDSAEADELWTSIYGKERWRRNLTFLNPAAMNAISDQQLWQMASTARARLVNYARERFIRQWRQESTADTCALPSYIPLDPNILTIGFARRFAEYKRPDLLLTDPHRLHKILCNPKMPVQLIVAGKAHPADTIGKKKLQAWQRFQANAAVKMHVIFLEDYDIALAKQLVQGADLWINCPRRPWEACGTSGMKVLVNGGLNLSSLDGWWSEAYQPDIGWAFGGSNTHLPDQDCTDADALYQLLEDEIVPLFYKRDSEGIPCGWIERMRNSMSLLTPQFSSNRMMQEYLDNYYLPAANNFRARHNNQGALARKLVQWNQQLHQHWHEIHIASRTIKKTEQGWHLTTTIYLGGVEPESIAVEAIADPRDSYCAESIKLSLDNQIESAINAYRYSCHYTGHRVQEDFTLRVIAAHPEAKVPLENSLIFWETR